MNTGTPGERTLERIKFPTYFKGLLTAIAVVAVDVFYRTQDKHFLPTQTLEYYIHFKFYIENKPFYIPYCHHVDAFLYIFADAE